MIKVGIFTCNSFSKIHPRIQMQLDILRVNGFEVSLIKSKWNKEGVLFEILNILCLKYFKWRAIRSFSKRIKEFDVIHIYDFQLLPLAKMAKREGKKVVYETLDDNVHLNFYAVAKKIPVLNLFKKFIIRKYGKYEMQMSNRYCDKVIVNSPNLQMNFKNSDLIYYASNLESIKSESYNDSKETVFLYLGKLTIDKGAEIYLNLIKKHKRRMIFLGKAMDTFSRNLLNEENVDYLGEFSSEELIVRLSVIVVQYNVIGLSIVLPINKSYELQEANKDIDYLAMSIPFVGNERKPTFEKIEGGAGVIYTDKVKIDGLIANENNAYNLAKGKAGELYQKYSTNNFSEKLLDIYNG